MIDLNDVISLHRIQRSGDSIAELLDLAPGLNLWLHTVEMQPIREPSPSSEWWQAVASCDVLSNNVDSRPSVESIGNIFFSQVDPEPHEVLRV